MNGFLLQRNRAFTLVEVTLTLGIISFSLVAMLALFDVGLTASRLAEEDTIFPQIAVKALNDHQTLASLSVNDSHVYYFDDQGAEVNGSDFVYRCTVLRIEPQGMPLDVGDQLRFIKVSVDSKSGEEERFHSTVLP